VLPETLKFIQDHHADLSERRCAVFVVCMTLALHNASAYRDQVSNFLAPVREYVSPVKEEYFAGALDLNKIPSFADRLKFKLSIQLGVWSEGDHRDWDAIRKWARAVSPLLH
jgi:menaquinone-dependent protoporphyrinogen IX oxidase